MNKSDLIERVALEVDMSKADASRAVNAVFGAIETELAQGGEFQITGFGKFFVTETKAKNGRNPRTGEAIQIEARKVPKFKAGVTLKSAVAG